MKLFPCVLAVLTMAGVTISSSLQAQSAANFKWVTNANGTLTITGYKDITGAVFIPPFINGLVTGIGDWAFMDCRAMTSLTVTNTLESIGEGAFYLCTGLTNVTIPQSLKPFVIGKQAFLQCQSLRSVTLSASTASIGEQAFYGCSSLTNLVLPRNVNNLSIGSYVFTGTGKPITLTATKSIQQTLLLDPSLYGLDESLTKWVLYPTFTFISPTVSEFPYAPGKRFDLSATSSSGGAISFKSSDSRVISITGTTAMILGVGKVTLTATVAAINDYLGASAAKVIVIKPGTPTLSFNLPSSPWIYSLGKTFPLNATSTSGGKITFTSTNPKVVSVTGTTATIKGKGTATLKATLSQTTNYLEASISKNIIVK